MKRFSIVIFSLLIGLPLMVMAFPAAFIEGVHYKPTTVKLPTQSEGKVEVWELFSYSCPHCFHFEPQVLEWKKHLPENIKFIRVPAIFRDSWLEQAKVFYAAQITGDLETLHPLLFNAIHVEKRRLNTEEQLLDFVAQQGIDRDKFAKVMHSMAVKAKVKQALLISQRSGITGVPSMIVDGKYYTDSGLAGGFDNMLETVNFLAQQQGK